MSYRPGARGLGYSMSGRTNRPALTFNEDGLMLARLSNSLAKATRSMTDNDTWEVTVRRDTAKSRARCTLGKGANTITIDVCLPEDTHPANSRQFIDEVLALYYHELSHAWWSPNYTGFSSASRTWLQAANLLEDKRIATLSAACYPNLATYFRRGFNRMIMLDEFNQLKATEKLRSAYVIAAGRRYLDPTLIQSLRDGFICPDLIDRIDDLTEEYKSFRAADLRAGRHKTIVDEFTEIVETITNAAQDESGMNFDLRANPLFDTPHEVGAVPDRGMPNKNEEKDAFTLVENEDADTFENTGGKPSEDQDETDQNEGEETESEQTSTDSTADNDTDSTADVDADEGSDSGLDGPDSDEDASAGGSDGTGDSDTSTGESDGSMDASGTGDDPDTDDQGSGAGNGQAKRPILSAEEIKEVIDAIRDAATQSESDERVNDQSEAAALDILATMSGDAPVEQLNPEPMYPVTSAMESSAIEFSNNMSRLVTPDVDPGWDRLQSSGRINVGRYMRGDSFDTVFDRWSPGHNDAFELKAAVMTDRSSSMNGRLNAGVSQSAWVIRHGLELNGAKVRTISWAYGPDYDYLHGDNKVGHEYPVAVADGGTHPSLALLDVKMWMDSTKEKNKVVFILTDGEWFDPEDHDMILSTMMENGIYIVIVGLEIDIERIGVKNYHEAHSISDPLDLTKVAESVVLNMYERIGHQVQLEGRY